MKQKISVMIGTRPEAIKMAPVSKALRNMPEIFDVSVCSTGQHASMLDETLEALNLSVDTELNLMRANQSLTTLTKNLLEGIATYFENFKPDLVLVHGDTTTAMVACMAAFYQQISVGHVEAGLRTFDMSAPFPEEFNRSMISLIAKYHYAPTQMARDNLIKEGCNKKAIVVTGNTVIDALNQIIEHTEKTDNNSVIATLNALLDFDISNTDYVLITAHRRENWGKGIDEICLAIHHLAEIYPNYKFVYPVHLNPNVRDVVYKKLNSVDNIKLIPPQNYANFALLMKNCYLMLTDSGGLQEEAPALGKPLLVLRDVSERPEAIASGTALLVGASSENIVTQTKNLIDDKFIYDKMAKATNPFGQGNAAKQIARHLQGELQNVN